MSDEPNNNAEGNAPEGERPDVQAETNDESAAASEELEDLEPVKDPKGGWGSARA